MVRINLLTKCDGRIHQCINEMCKVELTKQGLFDQARFIHQAELMFINEMWWLIHQARFINEMWW